MDLERAIADDLRGVRGAEDLPGFVRVIDALESGRPPRPGRDTRRRALVLLGLGRVEDALGLLATELLGEAPEGGAAPKKAKKKKAGAKAKAKKKAAKKKAKGKGAKKKKKASKR